MESADVVWNDWSHRWHSITIVSAIVRSKHPQTLSDSLSQFGLKKVELRLRAMQVWIWSILHNLARLRMVSHHAHIWFSSCCYWICSQGATPALPPCFSLIFSELTCGLFLYSSPQMLLHLIEGVFICAVCRAETSSLCDIQRCFSSPRITSHRYT